VHGTKDQLSSFLPLVFEQIYLTSPDLSQALSDQLLTT